MQGHIGVGRAQATGFLAGFSVRTELLITALSWLMVLVLLGALIGQAIR